jgi:hypothetical protein
MDDSAADILLSTETKTYDFKVLKPSASEAKTFPIVYSVSSLKVQWEKTEGR